MKLPTIKEVAALVKALKREIGDEYRAEGDEDSATPSMQVTIGIDPDTGAWSYQTGDNSYTGGAYGFRYWGIATITRRSNSRAVARELIDDAASQVEV